MRRLAPILALTLALTVAPPVHAAAGDLDTTFGGDGIVLGFPTGAIGTAMVLDSARRTVVVGYSLDVTVDVVAARFLPDGTPDTTFGGDGRVRVDLLNQDLALDVAVAPDDGLAIVGRENTNAGSDAFVLRLDPFGAPLTSFGAGTGATTVSWGRREEVAAAAAFTPGGVLVVGGYVSKSTTSNTAFAQLLPDGTLDPTFGTNGKVLLNLSDGTEQVKDLLVQANGRITAVGYAEKSLVPRFVAIRLLASGAVDPVFGTGGVVKLDLGPGADKAVAITRQPDGLYVVVGSADDGGKAGWAIVRLRLHGGLDTSFSGDGSLILPFSAAIDDARAVVATDTRLIVAGRIHTKGGLDDLGVVRLRLDGSTDARFGRNGVAKIDVAGRNDWATSVALTPAGRIVVGGTGYRLGAYHLAAARLRSG